MEKEICINYNFSLHFFQYSEPAIILSVFSNNNHIGKCDVICKDCAPPYKIF